MCNDPRLQRIMHRVNSCFTVFGTPDWCLRVSDYLLECASLHSQLVALITDNQCNQAVFQILTNGRRDSDLTVSANEFRVYNRKLMQRTYRLVRRMLHSHNDQSWKWIALGGGDDRRNGRTGIGD